MLRLSALALVLSASSFAGIIDFAVDTTALVGHPAGPFSIEFQLIDGSGINDANNTFAIPTSSLGADRLPDHQPLPVARPGASGVRLR